jgi:toxin ParE1/3/4
MKRYRLTPRARADLSHIWRTTKETWGSDQAERYLREIEQALERLGDNPALALNSDHIRKDYLRFRVASHMLFFKRRDNIIDVMRILHGRQNFTRHL